MKLIWEKLWPELKPYKSTLIVVIILGALVSALHNGTALLLNKLVDEAWGTGNKDLAIQIPLLVALIWMASGVARYFHIYWMKYTTDRIAMKLRLDLMNKYLSLNLGFFQKFVRGSGGLISRMVNDIYIVQANMHKLADFVREPFRALFAVGVLIYVDWKLLIFVGLALPLITFVAKRFAQSLRKYVNRRQEDMEDLTNTLKESLDGTRIVQSFNLEEEMRERFNRQSLNYLENVRKILSREEASGPISESLAALAQAAILIYVGNQVIGNQLTLGDFTGFLVAVGLLQDAVKKIQYSYIKLQQTTVSLVRLHEILDSDSTVPVIDEPESFPLDWEEIKYDNVSFHYDTEPVLQNVNLTIRRGEVVAIVGMSGGGKSTLVNLLERFFDPTNGRILIGGIDIKDLNLQELRDNVALVTQDVFLFSDSIEKNIQLGRPGKDPVHIERAAKLANAHDFITKTPEGYKSKVGDRGSRLSGGEKQRISIARAIFKDAPILILDEATSALDTESELEVQKGLDHLMQGRTAFVIAHRLSTIMGADRILVLKGGHIVEEGSHADLLERKGEYYRFHQLQRG